jgi:hypothetical protein
MKVLKMNSDMCKRYVSKECPSGSQQFGVLLFFEVANSAFNCGYYRLKRREIFW